MNQTGIWKEDFYAQNENAFCVFIEWAKGLNLDFALNELDRPWTNMGVSFNYKLIIEIPIDNKELLRALFVLVDGAGFKVSADYSVHFKEEVTENGGEERFVIAKVAA